MKFLYAIAILLPLICVSPALAGKCYGDHQCTACKDCNYCKNCNNGGELCGVYYQSRGITPPWEKKKTQKQGAPATKNVR